MNISDCEIESTEKLLLPSNAHFSEEARTIIRYWDSTDVAACPGSGKTTILLAKLKLLADRMPFENNSGVCVLSHTNVAIDEIRNRLSEYCDKLLRYPNFIGTIQSFIDKFVTLPYMRKAVNQNIQIIDDDAFAKQVQIKLQKREKYRTLSYLINNNFNRNERFSNVSDYIQALYINDNGALCVEKQKKILAGADKESTKQYNSLINDILIGDGTMRYKDAYKYAEEAINDLRDSYTNLFSLRFKYVFIDEYQDCNDIQRKAIDLIFNDKKCKVIKIGDPDQAIYNYEKDRTPDWIPKAGCLSLTKSCRYSQEIADVICKLKNKEKNIETTIGKTGIKPVLIVFNPDKIENVLKEFINVLERKKIYDIKGIYKAVGAIKNEAMVGLKVGSYWKGYDSSVNEKTEYNYWKMVDKIVSYLSEGQLYKVERVVRKLLCRIFHYISNISKSQFDKDFTVAAGKIFLDKCYKDQYHQWIYDMSQNNYNNRQLMDSYIRQEINKLIKVLNLNIDDVFNFIPEYFLFESDVVKQKIKFKDNAFVDTTSGRRIVFDTIHGVKGETHDATLYLETEKNRNSDLNRILPYFGIGKIGESNSYNYARKLAYVGMSRAKKLLCVAIQSKTYEKSKNIFDDDWEIVDLRSEDSVLLNSNKT